MFSIFSDAARLPPEIPNNFIFQFDYQVTDRFEIEIGMEIGEFIFVSDQNQSTTEKKPLKPVQQKPQKQLEQRNTQKKTSNNKQKPKHKLTTEPKQTELKQNDSEKPSNTNLEKTEPKRIIKEKTQPRTKLEPAEKIEPTEKIEPREKPQPRKLAAKNFKANKLKSEKTDKTEPESRMTKQNKVELKRKKETKNERIKKSNERQTKQRALLMKKEWLNKILSDGKIWEIRGSNTRIRGKIFLAFKNHIYGEAVITQSIETNKEELETLENKQKHQINDSALYTKYKKIYRWVLSDVKKYLSPIEFPRKKGQVIWCVIDNDIITG